MQVFPNDSQFEEQTITEVRDEGDYHAVQCGGWWLHVSSYGIAPKVGDTIRTYGKGVGCVVRGVFIDGAKAFYRTEEEEAARHRDWVQELHESP